MSFKIDNSNVRGNQFPTEVKLNKLDVAMKVCIALAIVGVISTISLAWIHCHSEPTLPNETSPFAIPLCCTFLAGTSFGALGLLFYQISSEHRTQTKSILELAKLKVIA